MQLSLMVNGIRQRIDVPPTLRLIDLLRDELGLTGTKEGCSEGECGSCTVLLDGRAVCSCLILAVQARDREVLTIEGLATNGELDVIQRMFIDHGAVQCGFCTPGMILSAKALLDQDPHPTEAEIRAALAGNLCRCTGYTTIVAAVSAAADAAAAASVAAASRTATVTEDRS